MFDSYILNIGLANGLLISKFKHILRFRTVFKVDSSENEISVENSELKLNIRKDSGLLDSTYLKSTAETIKTSINFLTYVLQCSYCELILY